MTNEKSAKALVEGKKIVVSGKFSNFTQRATLEAIIQWFGGKVASSISKSTNYLVAGEAVGPAKLAKCKELGIPIVFEEEFVELMRNDTIVIPDGVVEIADNAFYKCSGLTHVVIPESVTTIGKAFTACENLETVELPSSVTKIHWDCFYCCGNLKEIKLAPGNKVFKSHKGIILCGDSVFICPPKLPIEVVDLPKGIKYVGGFHWNNYIREVKLPEGVEKIGEYAFCNCKNLEKINLPDSIKSIGTGAFGFSALTSVTIPNSIVEIRWHTFWNCEKLKNVKLPESLKSISLNAFENCQVLEEVEIPDSVVKIGLGAFSNCTSIKHIRLPKSLEDLESSAFMGCKIKSVEIPENFQLWRGDIRRYSGFEKCETVTKY